ncbi:hypothetical protein MAQ5080_02577 [Marinomonas aquimarina]|uniref:DNA helicase n=1 Tax=Marinomonas aquimarina TaxID=295068 RepID=A0A1A8TL08_9GAMM|nr:DUF3320 domain-containing protein [Marinomonas aquimarina]SBS33424.1 hypothetical protein MAQ5080_02577 [Marinomonas aquimarina]
MTTNTTSTFCKLSVQLVNKINFASHQSSFSILREIQLENISDEVLENLEIRLTSSPAFLKPKTWKVDRLSAGSVLPIKERDLELDGGFLMGLTESISGLITVVVYQGDELLAESDHKVDLLAHNEWGGAEYMPELLAAFCTPNNVAVDRILKDASRVLRQAGKPDQIDGYVSKSRERVWSIASSIYTAIANLQLSYALPPSSFERNGQKVRFHNQVIESGLATCLDSTMLFAAAFEQAGLNPLIVLKEGHALVGLWLQPEELSAVTTDEAEVLRKRLPDHELILIETTLVTNHPTVSFSKAIERGCQAISMDEDDLFELAIDIRRARSHKIRPLGFVQQSSRLDASLESNTSSDEVLEEAPSLPDFEDESFEQEPIKTPGGRLDRWQRKLLELSARNPLLNHKDGRASLSFVAPDAGLLEDLLADGARISISPFPELSSSKQDSEIHEQRTGENIQKDYACDALNKKQLLVNLTEDELNKRAVEIYRKAQTSMQEGGSNTLYLAIGFLFWKQNKKDGKRYRAPLILLPVALERKSVRSGIKIIAGDDEPTFNTTLLEMLKRDFGIDLGYLAGDLPKDDSGLDVAKIFSWVRAAVKDAAGFELVDQVALGHFSFAKYLMWKDLVDRADQLKQSPVVKHLLETPRERYDSDISFVEPNQLDYQFNPSDLLTPLPADSSQMAAVATADRGKDFVIIGPPGTGKSQTISNLIAHMLGKGKKVLFVSEKTAALEVVHRRLKDIGLGSFCLELHSNKAKKADVLAQLNASWTQSNSYTAETWHSKSEQLKHDRDKLNNLVEALHRKRSNGLTAHYAMGIKVRDAHLLDKVELSWSTASDHTQQDLDQMRHAVANLSVQASAIGTINQHPLSYIQADDWGPAWQDALIHSAQTLKDTAIEAKKAVEDFVNALGFEFGAISLNQLAMLEELGQVLLDSYRTQSGFALEPDGQDLIEALEQAVTLLQSYIRLQSELSCDYAPLSWKSIDPEALKSDWDSANESWWLKRIFATRRIIKDVKAKGALGEPDLDQDIQVLLDLKQKGESIAELDNQLSSLKDWKSHDTKPDVVTSLQLIGVRARKAVSQMATDTETLMALRSKVRTLLHDGNDLLAPDGIVGIAINRMISSTSKFEVSFNDFKLKAASERVNSLEHFDEVIELSDIVLSKQSGLKSWCAWNKRKHEAQNLRLGSLVDAIETGVIAAPQAEDAFEAAYCAWWSKVVIDEDRVLREFSSPEHEQTITNFQELDKEFCQLTAQYIAAKLSGQIPSTDAGTRASSWGILRHEIQKKTRHKPVRQLLEEAPDAVTTLAPCMMMSPLSIAQFLGAGKNLFDVVIFDEASQITVWDAVGALARGKQVIVAGDPKQMPPTNFFGRSDSDPDGDVDGEGDLESILDELLGASIPQRLLNLHYRSRRESLIAFSNSNYYDSSLVTFPAPVHPDNGVRLVKPNGFYARGKARHNQGEAKAVVAEIIDRLKSDDEVIRNQSIGVVTFNTEQQSLIQDLLDEARSEDPSIEWAFAEDHLESVFVKNLETVQGDERDVILFSITYGPDESGHVAMNFGPLNRTGGERRLNVAMTRARSEMVVFSILSPDRIDLSRTQSRAVADLKHFLEYAERGPVELGSQSKGSQGDFESPFEMAVAKELEAKGWQLHPQVGVSAYRIDMGIVHPDLPGRYLAGIECDGAMYHSSAYARERDKIRQSVLESLGWTIVRVWSTDWWVNKTASLDQLHQRLEELLENSRAEIELEKAKAEEKARDKKAVEALEERESTEIDESKQLYARKQMISSDNEKLEEYVVTDLRDLEASSDRFYDDDYLPTVEKMVSRVIEVESPIHQDILCKRIARHHGFKRTGNQIKERICSVADRFFTTEEDVGVFYWKENNMKIPVRAFHRDTDMSKVENISREEIIAIMEATGDSGDFSEFARVVGIRRITQQIRERLILI